MHSSTSLVCKKEHLEILEKCANDLSLSEDPEQMIDAICKRLAQALRLEIYLVFLENQEGRALCCNFGTLSEIPPEWWKANSALCHCEIPCRPTVVVDARRQTKCAARQIFQSCGLKAFACVWMGVHGTFFGRLLFGSRTRDRLRDDELTLIEAVGDHISMALERTRLIAH